MSEAIYSQLIAFYDKSPDGLLIIRGRVIQHANQAMNDLFGMDLTEKLLYDVFDSSLIETIYTGFSESNILVLDDEMVAGRHSTMRAMKTADGCIIVTRMLCNGEKNKSRAQFSAQTIHSLALLFRDPIMTITTALEVMKKKLPKDVYIQVEKYIKIINHRCFRALKSAEMICEEAEYILDIDANYRISNHDISHVLKNIVEQISNLTGDDKNCIVLKDIPEKYVLACNANQLQSAIYCTISALLQGSKKEEKVEISLVSCENQTILHFYGKGSAWGREYIQFMNKKRVNYLIDDIQKYGYDMLRVHNIIERHGGHILVDTPEQGGNHIALILPNIKMPLSMEEPCKILDEKSAMLTQLSGILSSDLYDLNNI